MKELIEIIEKHKSKNNDEICEDLIDIIKEFNISSKEDLLVFENKYFPTTKLEDNLDIKYNAYLMDTTQYELLDSDVIGEIKEYEELYLKEENTLNKCKYLILIYNLLEWELSFPYEAFILIEKDELK